VKILYVASEVHPFAKTGGLADVAASLPAVLNQTGHEVKVVMPQYGLIDPDRWGIRYLSQLNIKLSAKDYLFTLSVSELPGLPVEVIFLFQEDLFSHRGIYQADSGLAYPDNLERFAAFSRAVLEVPEQLDWWPDVIHGNDWQTAAIFPYWRHGLKRSLEAKAPGKKIGTVFTIHNLGYPGLFPGAEFETLGLPREYFGIEGLEFFGMVNLMKGGILFADILNTVSPTYSREILTPEFGYGLDGLLRKRGADLFGILNGVDYSEWDPSKDHYLPHLYDVSNLRGKKECKKALQQELNLPKKNVPLLGMISRMTVQKGVDLLLEVLEELMYLNLQMVVLGEGEPRIHQEIHKMADRFPRKLVFISKFDERLSHLIQAGSDIFLMPSRYEPCGLAQLYSQRYGTLPVVHKTGGLADSVIDALPSRIASNEATGFTFEPDSARAFLASVRLALALYKDKSLWVGLVKTAMQADFSWGRSVKEYSELYEKAFTRA
jgi:starch synthase